VSRSRSAIGPHSGDHIVDSLGAATVFNDVDLGLTSFLCGKYVSCHGSFSDDW
jgi:hypothetical protein